MTTPPLTHIDNAQDEIHSHDVIARIVELEHRRAAADDYGDAPEFTDEERSELLELVDLERQCKARAPWAWKVGAVLVQASDDLADVDFAGVAYALRVG